MSDHGYTDEQIFAEKLRKAGRDMQITGAAMMAGIAKTLFSHRNGETEQPTIEGFYWIDADITSFVRVHVHEPRHLYVWGLGLPGFLTYAQYENCRWWGPVTPPWEQGNG